MLLAVLGRAFEVGQFVFQGQNDEVAGVHPQRGRFGAFFIDEAVASRPVALTGVARSEFNFEYTFVAASTLWLSNQTAFLGARAKGRLDLRIQTPPRGWKAQATEQDQK